MYAIARKRDLIENEVEIPIRDIIIKPEVFQVRLDELRRDVVNTYKNAYQRGDNMPPVIVASIKGVYYLIDGFHRMEALRWLHRDRVAAEVIPVKNEEKARWLAVKYNSTHGLRLTNKDRAKAFETFIEAKEHLVDGKKGHYKSMRGMEKDFKLWSHVTIGNYLRSHYPSIYYSLNVHVPEDELGNDKEFPEVKTTYHISREQSVLDTLREVYKEVPTLGKVGKRKIKAICEELISIIEKTNEDSSSKDFDFSLENQGNLNELFYMGDIETEDNPDF